MHGKSIPARRRFGEDAILPVVDDQKRILTPEELQRERNEYGKLHDSRVAHYYREAWKECMMECETPPSPAKIQHLVQVWKVLWRMYRRKMRG